MAPLPPNSTARYVVKYRANGLEHTTQFRYLDAPGGSPPDAAFLDDVQTFFVQLQGYFPTDFAYLSAEYVPTGSNVSSPTSVPGVNPVGAATPNIAERPGYIDFVGRSEGGRRARITILGVGVTPVGEGGAANDYRITASEAIAINNALNTLTNAGVVGIDGEPVVWKPYVNAGYNVYYQRKARG